MAAPASSPLAELLCGVCQEDLLSENGGAELGEIDSCRHRFCFPCISKWAEVENSCPFCKQRFFKLRRKRLAPKGALLGLDAGSELPGIYLDTQDVEQRNQRVVFEDPQFQQWIETVACLACGGGEDEDQLLLCDGCDRACHTYCAGMRQIPEGEWFCPHCQQQRVAQTRQGQQRRQQQPAAAGRSGRRQREEVVVLSSSAEEELEEEEDGGRPARRRRTASGARSGAAAAGRRGGAGRRPGRGPSAAAAAGTGAREGDLSDFLVSDSEEEEDWLSDASPEAARPAARGRSRGAAAAPRQRQRTQRGGGEAAGSRRRRRRQPAASAGSDESTHERFEDSEPEADFTDSGASSSEEEQQLADEDQPLLARLQQRRNGASRANGSSGSRRGQASGAAAAGGSRARAGARQQERGSGGGAAGAARPGARPEAVVDGDDAPTQAHRDVNQIAENWARLQSGDITFGSLRRSGSAGNGRQTAAAAGAQPQRRRLVRAGALGGGGSAAAASGGASGGGDYVDLAGSPSPARVRAQRAAAPGARGDEELSWEALQAALEDSGGGGRQGQGAARRRALGGASAGHQCVVSPAGAGETDDSDFDVPVAVRARRALAAARERGSLLLPRQQQRQQAAPPSTGRRTVGDMRLMAAAVRAGGSGNTPGSGGTGQPTPLIPRMRGFEEAGRGAGGGSSGRGAQQQQQRQQQAGASTLMNPFNRFQCGGGPASRDPPRREGSPQPLYRSSHLGGRGGGYAYHHQQQQQEQDGMGRYPQAQAPLQGQPGTAQQQAQQRPSPSQQQRQQQQPLPPSRLVQPYQQAQQQHPQEHPARQMPPWQQQPAGSWQPSPRLSPALSPGLAPGALQGPEVTPRILPTVSGSARGSGLSWPATGGSTPSAAFSFHTARESLPPRSGSWGGGEERLASAAAAAAARAGSAPSPWPAAPWQQQQQQPAPLPQGAPLPPVPPAAPVLPVQHSQQLLVAVQQQPGPPHQREQHAQPPSVSPSTVRGQWQALLAGGLPPPPGSLPLPPGALSKHEIMDRLKPVLKQRLADGLLNRDSYKLAAKESVGRVFEAQQDPAWPGLTEEHAQQAVQAAVQRVLDGSLR